jgi:hypothetical protein
MPSAKAAGSTTCGTLTCRTSFAYTGSAQSFTVPTGVSRLTAVLLGGAGGVGSNHAAAESTPGGSGGVLEATVPVHAGEVLTIAVGGKGVDYALPDGQALPGAPTSQGVYGGGGAPGIPPGAGVPSGSGGGGGSFIFSGGSLLAAAGGGGGGGFGSAAGGDGGPVAGSLNLAGHDGQPSGSGGGGGATGSAPGAAGAGLAGEPTLGGTPGTGPAKATGGTPTFGTGGSTSDSYAGPGGGGYYGGGSGGRLALLDSGGGGGGSGYLAPGDTATTATAGTVATGAGKVTLIYAKDAAAPPSAPLDVRAHWSGPNQITVTWQPPASSGSAPIKDYVVGIGNGGNGDGGQYPASARSAVFSNVHGGGYQASVGAENAAGAGPRVFVPVAAATQPSSGSASSTAPTGPHLANTGAPDIARTLGMAILLLALGSFALGVSYRRRPHPVSLQA